MGREYTLPGRSAITSLNQSRLHGAWRRQRSDYPSNELPYRQLEGGLPPIEDCAYPTECLFCRSSPVY